MEEAIRAWELSLPEIVASEWGYPFPESKRIPKGCPVQLGGNYLLPNPSVQNVLSLSDHESIPPSDFHFWGKHTDNLTEKGYLLFSFVLRSAIPHPRSPANRILRSIGGSFFVVIIGREDRGIL